jgi:hypothetical protein
MLMAQVSQSTVRLSFLGAAGQGVSSQVSCKKLALFGKFTKTLRPPILHLTTNRISGFFGEFSAVVPKADHSRFIAVGITPGQDAGSLGASLGRPLRRPTPKKRDVSAKAYRCCLIRLFQRQ